MRTRNPHGGADAVSIMHTADTSKSDLDLAGLMIRCREGGTEIVACFHDGRSRSGRSHPSFSASQDMKPGSRQPSPRPVRRF